ncbi:unnamed protein product, partial [Lota lota]
KALTTPLYTHYYCRKATPPLYTLLLQEGHAPFIHITTAGRPWPRPLYTHYYSRKATPLYTHYYCRKATPPLYTLLLQEGPGHAPFIHITTAGRP